MQGQGWLNLRNFISNNVVVDDARQLQLGIESRIENCHCCCCAVMDLPSNGRDGCRTCMWIWDPGVSSESPLCAFAHQVSVNVVCFAGLCCACTHRNCYTLCFMYCAAEAAKRPHLHSIVISMQQVRHFCFAFFLSFAMPQNVFLAMKAPPHIYVGKLAKHNPHAAMLGWEPRGRAE